MTAVSQPIELSPLRVIGAVPWWMYDRRQFPTFTREQIEAGLTRPACEEAK